MDVISKPHHNGYIRQSSCWKYIRQTAHKTPDHITLQLRRFLNSETSETAIWGVLHGTKDSLDTIREKAYRSESSET